MNDRIHALGLVKHAADPVKDPEIQHAIGEMDLSELTRASFRRVDLANDFTKTYHDWITGSSLNSLRGLDSYDRYMCFAVTHVIEQWLMHNRARRFRIFRAEYPGTRDLIQLNGLGLEYLEDSDLAEGDAVIISLPFSGSGSEHPRTKEVLQSASELGLPILVDCAFYGLCHGIDIDFSLYQIDTIAFSLSKCFAMNFYRIGMVYSRNVPPAIKLLHSRNYVSRLGIAVATRLLQRFTADYLPNKYMDAQTMIAEKLGDAVPSKTVSFLIGGDGWRDYDRGGFNRLGIAHMLPTNEIGHRPITFNKWTGLGGRMLFPHISRILKDLDHPSERAVDMGCGCGVIGTLVLLEKLSKTMTLCDIDQQSCNIARENLLQHGLENEAVIVQSDGWNSIEGRKIYQDGRFDLLLGNLPLAYKDIPVEEGVNPARYINPGWRLQLSVFDEIHKAMKPGAIIIMNDLINPGQPWIDAALEKTELIETLTSFNENLHGELFRIGTRLLGYRKFPKEITFLSGTHVCLRVLRVK